VSFDLILVFFNLLVSYIYYYSCLRESRSYCFIHAEYLVQAQSCVRYSFVHDHKTSQFMQSHFQHRMCGSSLNCEHGMVPLPYRFTCLITAGHNPRPPWLYEPCRRYRGFRHSLSPAALFPHQATANPGPNLPPWVGAIGYISSPSSDLSFRPPALAQDSAPCRQIPPQ